MKPFRYRSDRELRDFAKWMDDVRAHTVDSELFAKHTKRISEIMAEIHRRESNRKKESTP